MVELLSMEIENYRSFYTPQILNFERAGSETITALYGPNASGKSNVIKALQTIVACILNSANANWRLPYNPFLLRKGASARPTRFKITFRENERVFSYEYSYNGKAILNEALLERSPNSRKMKTIFRRNENRELNSTAAKYKFGKRVISKTRPETLLITKAREDNNEYANLVFGLLGSISIVSGDPYAGFQTPLFIEMLRTDEGLREKTVSLLRKCDIAIRDIKLRKTPIPERVLEFLPPDIPPQARQSILSEGATEFKTVHAVRDEENTVIDSVEFDFATMESAGTQKFFEVAVPIIDAIDTGKTLFIDEFSSYIHPILANAILELFRNQTSTSCPARLIVITHDTSIMSGLRREEMMLVEKTLGEESRILTFADAGARKGDAFEKKYRSGYYGGIPLIKA